MDEQLECGCVNKGCHFCGENDEIWATMKWEDAEAGVACLHICSDCSSRIISNNLTDEAKKEIGSLDEAEAQTTDSKES